MKEKDEKKLLKRIEKEFGEEVLLTIKRKRRNCVKYRKIELYSLYNILVELSPFIKRAEKKKDLINDILNRVADIRLRSNGDPYMYIKGMRHLNKLGKKKLMDLIKTRIVFVKKYIPEEFYEYISKRYKYWEKDYEFLKMLHERVLGKTNTYFLNEKEYIETFLETIEFLNNNQELMLKPIQVKLEKEVKKLLMDRELVPRANKYYLHHLQYLLNEYEKYHGDIKKEKTRVVAFLNATSTILDHIKSGTAIEEIAKNNLNRYELKV